MAAFQLKGQPLDSGLRRRFDQYQCAARGCPFLRIAQKVYWCVLPKDMNLAEAIRRSGIWINRCNELVGCLELRGDDRNRVVAALLHLSLEHHGSIQLLVCHHHNGSAFALLRPQFEAYIRGLWLMKCASDQQLQSFLEDNEPLGINRLIRAIEEQPGYEEKVLSGLKERIWGSLCGFTHGGYIQASWRMTEEEIISDFSEDHLVSLLITSCALSLQAYITMAKLVGSPKLADHIKETHQEIFGYKEWYNQ